MGNGFADGSMSGWWCGGDAACGGDSLGGTPWVEQVAGYAGLAVAGALLAAMVR